MPGTEWTRRTFLGSSLAAAAVGGAPAEPNASGNKFVIFSKHLQWAPWGEMAAAAMECGFDGIDLTVRKGGHVEPERVVDDLPRAAEAIRKAGSELVMITAGIVDAKSAHAEAILKTASALGVRADTLYVNGITETIFNISTGDAQGGIEAYRTRALTLGADDAQGILTGNLHYPDDASVSTRATALSTWSPTGWP